MNEKRAVSPHCLQTVLKIDIRLNYRENLVQTSQRTDSISIRKQIVLLLYRDMIGVCLVNYTKHANTIVWVTC